VEILKSYKLGEKVTWKWMGGVIHGKVEAIYFEPIVKVIKNKNIKRNGSKEKPAYLVKSEAGNLALKLHSELSLAQSLKI
jgi:hypothetical protein